MRFPFDVLPAPYAGERVRPTMDVTVEGLEIAPQKCLVDSGALGVRLGAYVAELGGIDLTGVPEERIVVGGATRSGRS